MKVSVILLIPCIVATLARGDKDKTRIGVHGSTEQQGPVGPAMKFAPSHIGKRDNNNVTVVEEGSERLEIVKSNTSSTKRQQEVEQPIGPPVNNDESGRQPGQSDREVSSAGSIPSADTDDVPTGPARKIRSVSGAAGPSGHPDESPCPHDQQRNRVTSTDEQSDGGTGGPSGWRPGGARPGGPR